LKKIIRVNEMYGGVGKGLLTVSSKYSMVYTMTSSALVELHGLRCPVITEAFKDLGVEYSEADAGAALVWWDGLPPITAFIALRPAQRMNRIPNMDRLCYKSTLFQALNQMQLLWPGLYRFFPRTLLLPYQFSEFQRLHMRLSGKIPHLTWILKPERGCCGIGIQLIQHPFDLGVSLSPSVIQQYVSPWLLNGFKFDFRFYMLISDLQPLSCYLYKEGIARFCTKRYRCPNRLNLSERFSHITNTAINVENARAEYTNFTRLASEVIAELEIDGLWERIKMVCAFTILALYPQIIGSVLEHMSGTPDTVDPLHRYFHIVGIDILIDDAGDPIVLELNDRPSMKVTFPLEHGLKKGLISDAMGIVGGVELPAGARNKWERILPGDECEPLGKLTRAIQQRSLNVFGPRKKIPTWGRDGKTVISPKPRVSKVKIMSELQ
jgi:hypothetical protein